MDFWVWQTADRTDFLAIDYVCAFSLFPFQVPLHTLITVSRLDKRVVVHSGFL